MHTLKNVKEETSLILLQHMHIPKPFYCKVVTTQAT